MRGTIYPIAWRFGLFVINGISTLDGYLMSNPVYYIYPTPPLGQNMTQGQFFKQSLTGLNSEFCPTIYPIAWRFGLFVINGISTLDGCNVTPLSPTTHSSSFSNLFFFSAGRWSTSGWGGNAHFFTATQEYDCGDRRK